MELPGLALRIRVLWARSIGSYHGRLREDSASGRTLILSGWFYLFDKSMRDKSMTSNIRALGRLRLAMLAVLVLVVLAAGNLFAAN